MYKNSMTPTTAIKTTYQKTKKGMFSNLTHEDQSIINNILKQEIERQKEENRISKLLREAEKAKEEGKYTKYKNTDELFQEVFSELEV